jgi:tetratricopeptide (TPR) repeat protein
LQLRRLEEAMEYVSHSDAAVPEQLEAPQLLGEMYLESDQYEDALTALTKARAALPQQTTWSRQGVEVLHSIGKCKLQMGHLEDAKKVLNQATTIMKDILPIDDILADEVRETLADVSLQEENFQSATQQLDRLSKKSDGVQIRQLSASRLRQLSMLAQGHCGTASWSQALAVVDEAAEEAENLYNTLLKAGAYLDASGRQQYYIPLLVYFLCWLSLCTE